MGDKIKIEQCPNGTAPAPYACRPEHSRGRLVEEPESPTRTCFQRDRDRIIHCAAFRRLAYKTQVFVNHEGDFFRTRLTHSLEVAQIARSICRYLRLNEDLGEALALAHDLGHPPFGHAGEDALKAALEPFGGFDHNAQSLKVVTQLEKSYPQFDGLNLTWETLEGIVKHNGPLTLKESNPELPIAIADYSQINDLELTTYAGLEAQIAALADDIAYNNHDIDDGLRAGLFSVSDLTDVPLVGPAFAQVEKEIPEASWSVKLSAVVRSLIGSMVDDLIGETSRRLAETRPASADELRRLGHPVAAFSETMQRHNLALKEFLFTHMYRHYRVNRMTSKGRRVVTDLFGLFLREPNCLPEPWNELAGQPSTRQTARVVADYVGGMTDRAALDEHRTLFDVHTRAS